MNGTTFSLLGAALGILSVLLAAMTVVSLLMDEAGLSGAFLFAGLVAAYVGGSLLLAFRNSGRRMLRSDITVLMLLIWAVLPAFAAVPLYLSGQFETVVRAYFEAVSGLTTTGATTSIKVENLSGAVLVWRAFLQLFGGGLTLLTAVLVLAPFDPATSPTNSTIPGYEQGDLVVSIARTSRDILPVYGLAFVLAFFGLWACGLEARDAFVYGSGAVSTSGFTSTNAGLGAYNSLTVEFIACLAMIFGATSILAHRSTLLRLPAGGHWDTRETWMMGVLLLMGCAAVVVIMLPQDAPMMEKLRIGIFRGISLVTTTGLDIGMGSVPPVPIVFVLAFIAIGGTAFSTAGGIKLFRMGTMLVQAHRELKRLIHPRGISSAVAAGKPFDIQIMKAIWALFVVFLAASGMIALTLGSQGETFDVSIMAAVASLSNTGPALGMSMETGVGPGSGYATMSSLSLISCAIGMIVGKLEFLAILGLIGTWWHSWR